MSAVWKIEEDLADQYHGAGLALAAITDGRVVKIVYLRDLLPGFEVARSGKMELFQALDDPRLGPAIRLLQSLGEVSVGMCSCWEFVEQ